MKTFRDIVAWQKSMQLALNVYSRTRAMPDGERFGLTSQLRRAASSVPANIAEGYGRQSRPDFLRFLRTARGSLFELQTHMELAQGLGMLDHDPEIESLLSETDRVLQGFIRGLEESPPRD